MVSSPDEMRTVTDLGAVSRARRAAAPAAVLLVVALAALVAAAGADGVANGTLLEGGDHGLSEHHLGVQRLVEEWLGRYLRDRTPWPSLEPRGIGPRRWRRAAGGRGSPGRRPVY